MASPLEKLLMGVGLLSIIIVVVGAGSYATTGDFNPLNIFINNTLPPGNTTVIVQNNYTIIMPEQQPVVIVITSTPTPLPSQTPTIQPTSMIEPTPTPIPTPMPTPKPTASPSNNKFQKQGDTYRGQVGRCWWTLKPLSGDVSLSMDMSTLKAAATITQPTSSNIVFEYDMGLIDWTIIDPISGEPSTAKATDSTIAIGLNGPDAVGLYINNAFITNILPPIYYTDNGHHWLLNYKVNTDSKTIMIKNLPETYHVTYPAHYSSS